MASVSLMVCAQQKPRSEHLTWGDAAMKNENEVYRSESIIFHFLMAIAGFVMMMVGVGLSVTMVLLPVGIPLGLAGLSVLMWGLTPAWRK
jgi:hypothetical protein